MNVIRNPYWLTPVFLLSLHQLFQYGFGWQIPFVDAYLDPLLTFPILLGLLLVERRWLFDVYRLSIFDVLVSTVVLSLFFEELFPVWQPAYVRDNWDYLAYGLGSCWFWWKINPPE